jgi:hypothetical protein
MKVFVEFIGVLVDYYLGKPLVTEPQMCDETKTFIWKLMVAKPNNEQALTVMAHNYTQFKWVEKHPGNKWCVLPRGIQNKEFDNEKSTYRIAKAIINNPKVPVKLGSGEGFTPLMYMLFEKGYYEIGQILFNKARQDCISKEFKEWPETSQTCYPDDPDVKTWAQAQEKYAKTWAEDDGPDSNKEESKTSPKCLSGNPLKKFTVPVPRHNKNGVLTDGTNRVCFCGVKLKVASEPYYTCGNAGCDCDYCQECYDKLG